MARFPWTHGHSKQGSDKIHAIAHDWFSKDAVEPSRQALNDLMKDPVVVTESREASPKYKGRTRTNTVNSSFSLYARSLSETSNETSRPSSRQSFVDHGRMPQERTETTTKSLISRGTRLLKRQGSKLNLMPSPLEDASGDVTEDRVKAYRQLATSPKRPGLKKVISTPFAFQHLTHADQAQFQSLDTVTKTQLVSDFHAIRTEQQAEDVIRGIPISDLPRTIPPPEFDGTESTSTATDAIALSPTTPPRPLPPPKDELSSPYSPTTFRMSRSMENFSRPTRLSVTSSDIASLSDQSSRPTAWAPASNTTAFGKPLPLVPDAVHAVSTKDDIALPLRTAPLPSPPKFVTEVIPEEEEEKAIIPPSSMTYSPVASHFSHTSSRSQPSIRHKRRSQSSGEIQFDSAYESVMSMVASEHTPDQATANGSVSPDSKKRLSVGVKMIDIGNWEDAIDYSWDHATDDDYLAGDDIQTHNADFSTKCHPLSREKYLTVEQQSIDEASSSASTPLMMQSTSKTIPVMQQAISSQSSLALLEEPSSPLLGLGIDSLTTIPAASLASNMISEIKTGDREYIGSTTVSPRSRRSPHSTMSKSSSQESIILSIASSIAGTHRSSNSSTSLSDFAHLANFGCSTPLDDYQRGSRETVRDSSRVSFSGSVPISEIIDPTKSTALDGEYTTYDAKIIIPTRKSSIADADATKMVSGRKRSNTGSSRPRRNTRVSYSLFPTAAPN